jgi:hypothetical protein
MPDESINLTCKACGHTFKVFLRDMAAHNLKVVCRSCGEAYAMTKADVPVKQIRSDLQTKK